MKKNAFTLIEILIVIIIVGILASMSVAFLFGDGGNQKVCSENLGTISSAIERYNKDHGEYPPDDLAAGNWLINTLYPAYISDQKTFKCPADTSASADSYTTFYVKRNSYSNMMAFSVGCPRHDKGKTAINMFFQGQVMKRSLEPVTNNGSPLDQSVPAYNLGTFSFSDGSTVNVTQGHLMLLESFSLGNGKCYSLLRPSNEQVTAECIITPGSKFEIITPAAIAGVEGTEFKFVYDPNPAGPVVSIGVRDGAVEIANKNGNVRRSVKSTEAVKLSRITNESNEQEDVIEGEQDSLKTWAAQPPTRKIINPDSYINVKPKISPRPITLNQNETN